MPEYNLEMTNKIYEYERILIRRRPSCNSSLAVGQLYKCSSRTESSYNLGASTYTVEIERLASMSGIVNFLSVGTLTREYIR